MPDNAARTMRQGRAWIVRAMLLLVRGYSAEKNLWLTAPIWPVKHDKDTEACQDMNDKSKPALSLVTPQARHHSSRLDQIDRLIRAADDTEDVGYMARLLALCSLPRTDPGNRLQYKRGNGPYKLVIIAGGDTKLPFGHIPTLLHGSRRRWNSPFPSGSVRRCVRTQAVRVWSLCSELSDRPESP